MSQPKAFQAFQRLILNRGHILHQEGFSLRSLLTDVCLLCGSTRTEPLILCLWAQPRADTVPYSVREITFCFKWVHCKKVVIQKLGDQSIGLFQKKSTPPRRMGFWKFSREGGSKTPEIQAGGGVDLKKVFCRGHFDR